MWEMQQDGDWLDVEEQAIEAMRKKGADFNAGSADAIYRRADDSITRIMSWCGDAAVVIRIDERGKDVTVLWGRLS